MNNEALKGFKGLALEKYEIVNENINNTDYGNIVCRSS